MASLSMVLFFVNESSMTGEPEAVRRDQDSSVYAGTVVEDGKAIVEVT